LLARGCHEVADLLRLPDVRAYEERLPARLADRALGVRARLLVDLADHDGAAEVRKPDRDRAADPLSRPGHYGGLAGHVEPLAHVCHRVPPPRADDSNWIDAGEPSGSRPRMHLGS